MEVLMSWCFFFFFVTLHVMCLDSLNLFLVLLLSFWQMWLKCVLFTSATYDLWIVGLWELCSISTPCFFFSLKNVNPQPLIVETADSGFFMRLSCSELWFFFTKSDNIWLNVVLTFFMFWALLDLIEFELVWNWWSFN